MLRKLADLHMGYETVKRADGVKVTETSEVLKTSDVFPGKTSEIFKYFKVVKMRFPTKEDKSKIIFNSKITIENIPLAAYEYVVNGRSAIEWIMERYQVTTNKDSGIKNDPNDWADEVGNPRYILDLVFEYN